MKDGKSLTAAALARTLAKNGRRTVFVEASGRVWNESLKREKLKSALPVIGVPEPPLGHSVESTRSFLRDIRDTYEFAIIDGAALVTDQLAMALASQVDGLLLTVRLGRAAQEEDDLVVRYIERVKSNVVGVVAASSVAIDEFNDERVGQHDLRRLRTINSVPDNSTFAI